MAAEGVDDTKDDGKETEVDLQDICEKGTLVHIVSENNLYLYDSSNKHDYKSKGIPAFRACAHKKANTWEETKAVWKIYDKTHYFLIQSAYRDAYLYDVGNFVFVCFCYTF